MLKKEVCKKCRIKAYKKKTEAWNDFAEAWFTGPADQVWCPMPIIEEVIRKKCRNKIKKVLTKNEFNFLYIRGLIRLEEALSSPLSRPSEPPPWWCPYIEEHAK